MPARVSGTKLALSALCGVNIGSCLTSAAPILLRPKFLPTRKIKLFLMDVDGTLTDGGVCLISSTAADGSGTAVVSEMKIFNAKDGQGLSLASAPLDQA
jgi:hypothetical protein